MRAISTKKELIKNLERIEQYLQSDQPEIYDKMARYIARGKCLVAYIVGGQYHFAPSRFVGYANNSLISHDENTSKHSGVTNPAITRILGEKQFIKKLEQSYFTYCEWLGVTPNDNKQAQRTYWLLNEDIVDEFKTSHFTEGKRKLVTHEISERDPRVVKEAKRIFKQEHSGELFCEICGFNFKAVYGKVGEDFIEAHHKVSLSSTSKEHDVKPSDLMMVCPNCHRMLHRQVNGKYMSIKQLQKALK